MTGEDLYIQLQITFARLVLLWINNVYLRRAYVFNNIQCRRLRREINSFHNHDLYVRPRQSKTNGYYSLISFLFRPFPCTRDNGVALVQLLSILIQLL